MPPTAFLRRLGAIVVPSRSDLNALTRRGLTNTHLIRPGIDVTRFIDTPVPPGPEFVLLSGSAPWTRSQSRTKGVDALLEAAREMPELRLVFLWRGVLLLELVARVRRLGLQCRPTGAFELPQRRLWQCKACGRQVSVTAGTVLHRTRVPLTVWFWAAIW